SVKAQLGAGLGFFPQWIAYILEVAVTPPRNITSLAAATECPSAQPGDARSEAHTWADMGALETQANEGARHPTRGGELLGPPNDAGDHFNQTYVWLNSPGELCEKNGFKILELASFLFDCPIPYYESLHRDWRKELKSTAAYLDSLQEKADEMEEGDEEKKRLTDLIAMKIEQLETGIKEPLMEQELYKKLEGKGEECAKFLRMYGLMQAKVRNDLKMFTHERGGRESPPSGFDTFATRTSRSSTAFGHGSRLLYQRPEPLRAAMASRARRNRFSEVELALNSVSAVRDDGRVLGKDKELAAKKTECLPQAVQSPWPQECKYQDSL
ncbi:hypothetical protein THAOC_37426, partial [Thalassiosira oceanica]